MKKYILGADNVTMPDYSYSCTSDEPPVDGCVPVEEHIQNGRILKSMTATSNGYYPLGTVECSAGFEWTNGADNMMFLDAICKQMTPAMSDFGWTIPTSWLARCSRVNDQGKWGRALTESKYMNVTLHLSTKNTAPISLGTL